MKIPFPNVHKKELKKSHGRPPGVSKTKSILQAQRACSNRVWNTTVQYRTVPYRTVPYSTLLPVQEKFAIATMLYTDKRTGTAGSFRVVFSCLPCTHEGCHTDAFRSTEPPRQQLLNLPILERVVLAAICGKNNQTATRTTV